MTGEENCPLTRVDPAGQRPSGGKNVARTFVNFTKDAGPRTPRAPLT